MGSFFTIASRFAIRCTPKASVTVTTMVKPSGIAATARLEHEMTIDRSSSFENARSKYLLKGRQILMEQ